MAWDKDQQVAALKDSLAKEQTAQTLYLEASRAAVDPSAKAVLAALAEDEVLHVRFIEAQLDAVSAGTWRPVEALVGKPARVAGAFLTPRTDFADAAQVKDDIAAMQAAMEREAASYKRYRGAEAGVDDATGKQFFRYLADWESTHYRTLKESIAYLGNPGMWFSLEEGARLEG